MKSDNSDLGHLKWAIAFLLILSACGGAAVWTTLQMQKAGERSIKEATAARSDIRAKLARARDEQEELRDKIGRYQAFRDRGYIGPEKRLDWVEAIARIKAARRIYKLDYEFSPQRPVDAAILPAGASAGGYEILASRMKLQVQVLHEGELLALLDDIRGAVRALIQLRSCEIERSLAGSGDRSNPAPLKAECVLEWITLREQK